MFNENKWISIIEGKKKKFHQLTCSIHKIPIILAAGFFLMVSIGEDLYGLVNVQPRDRHSSIYNIVNWEITSKTVRRRKKKYLNSWSKI